MKSHEFCSSARRKTRFCCRVSTLNTDDIIVAVYDAVSQVDLTFSKHRIAFI